MNTVLKKLGLLDESDTVLILNAPKEYHEIMKEINGEIHTEIKKKYKFIQIFAENMNDANKYAKEALEALDGDGHLWLCYPKGTSKKYKSDINRTKSWEVFSTYEFEPVSQVAIDENWTAMRFRHIDNIKNMKRKTAATEKGKERINSKN
ncbi:MAG: hypothetical protein K0R54_1187 [Clostridiaceae bacterium]|jgi:hypothetical protein|nr:hypothetical protein [Clostridiaceae bacterium]